MIKYAKVVNQETGLCEVGLGTNTEFYVSIGMEQLDVEQSEKDSQWYLSEKCPHYTPEELAEEREENFKNQFFEIPNYGWFRKVPKGYSSAVESLNTASIAVSFLQKLPANTLIFYQQPDFTKPEECTEEWLIEHQTTNAEMSVQEFGQFYLTFTAAWNTEMHENSESEE